MKISTHQPEITEAVPLAPLIDIVFLTLVFFMTTSVFATMEQEIDITLPSASEGEIVERSRGEIFINLREDGTVVLNGREVTLEEMDSILERVAEVYPGGAVIIRGDEASRLGNAVEILNLCTKHDIQHVSFAVVDEEPS